VPLVHPTVGGEVSAQKPESHHFCRFSQSLRSAQCPGSLQCPVTCPSRAPSASPPPVTTTTTTHRPFTATAHTRTHATPSPPAPLASTLVLARFRPLVHTPRLAPPSALCSACPVISFALGAFISPAIPTSPHRVLDDCERTASSSARDSV